MMEMLDLTDIQEGRAPWQPADDAELVEVLNHYDIPLVGLVRRGEMFYAFVCLEGQLEDVNLWGYLSLEPDEAHRLQTLETDVQTALWKLAQDRPTILALARNSRIVSHTLIQHPEKFGSAIEAAADLLGVTNRDISDMHAGAA
jgi:hypothetical protein